MNMTNQYKILALDLDGTLLDAQSRITPENARAVRMAQQAGVQIVLCTGRNVREVRRFSEQLEAAPDWLVTANGAAVQHPDDREPAFFDGLSTEMVDIILNECTAIDTDPCLYTTQDLYYGHAFRHFLENLQRRGRVVMDEADEGYHFVEDRNAWRAVLADEPRPFTKAILYHDDPNAIAPLTAVLDKYGIFELAPSVMYGGELRNVEVNRVGVHKGRGLEWLAHHLGCTLANVIAIGDSENDLTMLQMAGLGVAMANSEPCIREAADVITGSNTENGVAQARGVILLALAQKGLYPVSYTPNQVKLSVVGYGGAEKKQVMEMTKSILHLTKLPRPDDAADALALAICHGHSRQAMRYEGLL